MGRNEAAPLTYAMVELAASEADVRGGSA